MDRPGPTRTTDATLADASASSATGVAAVQTGFDVSGRTDVHLLKRQAIGLGGVLFILSTNRASRCNTHTEEDDDDDDGGGGGGFGTVLLQGAGGRDCG